MFTGITTVITVGSPLLPILSAWRRMQPKMLPGTAIERADEAFHRAGRRYVRLHMHAGFVLAKDADFLPADPTLRCID